jgi:hypothetical protein
MFRTDPPQGPPNMPIRRVLCVVALIVALLSLVNAGLPLVLLAVILLAIAGIV